jgi:hypothetical protein
MRPVVAASTRTRRSWLSLPIARGQDLVFATGMPPAGSDTGQVLAWLPQMWVGS